LCLGERKSLLTGIYSSIWRLSRRREIRRIQLTVQRPSHVVGEPHPRFKAAASTFTQLSRTAMALQYNRGRGFVQSFRRHQQLFLIALAVFLAQTFFALAHVHTSAGSSSREILNRSVCPSGTGEHCTAPNPTGDDADCPFCGAIHLASALIAPDGPAATLPILFAGDNAIVVVAITRLTPKASRFRARAPPAVPA
jgi:hypothetical protein